MSYGTGPLTLGLVLAHLVVPINIIMVAAGLHCFLPMLLPLWDSLTITPWTRRDSRGVLGSTLRQGPCRTWACPWV